MSSHNFIGLLNLKKDAIIGLDGQIIRLMTNDFVGISEIDNEFHLLSIRPHPNASIAVGFFVFQNVPLIRQYDPQTEEVSSQQVDDLTAKNLLEQVRNGHQSLPATSVPTYKSIVSNEQRVQWKEQTKFILDSGILQKRGIKSGDKVIPGSYNDDDPVSDLALPTKTTMDGISMKYPCIPVVDTTISLRTNRHAGTRRHLSRLSPSQRTQLFTEPQIARRLLQDVLSLHFDDSWEVLLGDLQLAYILFLYLQCLASLEHWKDLVAMLSMVDPGGMKEFQELYQTLLEILPSQLSTMDKGFLEDVDEAGNNFLLPSLKGLCRNLTQSKIIDDDDMIQFQRLLANKFPSFLLVDEDEEETLVDAMEDSDDDEDADDSDAPVVVEQVDIDASLARSSEATASYLGDSRNGLPPSILENYPLLVSAIQPHEDIWMTCARALDEKSDVSLVREAAAYLEEIDERKT